MFITAMANAQSTDLSLPVGKSSFTIDANKKVNWSGSNMKYDFGNLKYAGTFANNSQVHNFNAKLSDVTMSYTSSAPKNTVGITYRGFTFTAEDFNRNEVQNVFASKVLVDNKNTLSYQQKQLSISMSKTIGRNFNYDSYSFASKGTKIDYVASEKPLLMTDAWNRPYASETSIVFQSPTFSARMMDNYDDVQYTTKGFSVRTIHHPKRVENTLNYSNKNYNLSYVQFNDGYSKNFLNLNGKDFKFKMANDGETNISQLETKDTTIAHGDNQNFIQSKIDKVEYRLSENTGKFNYDVKVGSIGVRDGDTYGIVQPIKNVSVKASSENGVEQVSYNTSVNKTNIFLKYNNQFDVYDFYFKQNAFSVYENSFSLIGQNRSQFKDSFSFSLVNPKFNFASDVINDIYALTFKNSNNFVLSMIKDQKQNFLGLTNTGKFGNLGVQYNMNTQMFDRLSFNYVIKFH